VKIHRLQNYRICNTKASKIKQSIDSHFTAYPDQTEKNTQRPEANHLIVEYPEDKHRFTAYPDHFFLSLITTIRHKKTKLGIENQFLPSSRQEHSGSILRVWDREGTIGRSLGLWSRGECETGSQGRWSHKWGDLETGTKSQDSGGWSGTRVGIRKENRLVPYCPDPE